METGDSSWTVRYYTTGNETHPGRRSGMPAHEGFGLV